MSISLKDDILKAVREAKEFNAALTGCKTPKFRKPTPPPPPTSGSNAVKPTVKKPCIYETPCGWCTKWDKKCDKKPYKRGLRVKINPIDDAIGVSEKEVLTNQICKSAEDHEWECCGFYTEGSEYRCRKCGKYKFEPYTTSISSYYKGELL